MLRAALSFVVAVFAVIVDVPVFASGEKDVQGQRLRLPGSLEYDANVMRTWNKAAAVGFAAHTTCMKIVF